MIWDYIQNISDYKGLHKNLDIVIDFINTTTLSELPLGIHKIDENNFYNRFDAQFQNVNDRLFESHKHFADLHIDVLGNELIGYDNIKKLAGQTPYNANDDVYLYENIPYNLLEMNEQKFALFLPDEGHAPNIKNTTQNNKKIVFKIKWN